MKKSYLIHVAILVLFFIYLILSNLIFGRLIHVKGESALVSFNIPTSGNQVKFFTDLLQTTKQEWKEMIQIKGWAFAEGVNAGNSEIFIVLKSDTKTYIFNTGKDLRRDVAKTFNMNLGLQNSGFRGLISKDLIKNGTYRIGYCIKNGNNAFLTYSNDYFTKGGSSFYKGIVSSERQMKLPNEQGEIKWSIDSINENSQKGGNNKVINISGWAFIGGQDSTNRNIYIVLHSDNKTYVFDTISQERKDVTKAFKNQNLNLDNSGFIANILKDDLSKGTYKIGILIKKNNTESLTYTDKEIKVE